MRAALNIDIEKMPADPVIPDRLLPLFAHFVRQAPWVIAAMVAFNAVFAVLNTVGPYLVGVIVDLMAAGPDEATRDKIAGLSAVFVAVFLILMPLSRMAAIYTEQMVFLPFFGNMVRRQAHWYVLRHSLPYFQNDFAGRIATKVQQIGPSIRDVVYRSIGALIYMVVFMVSCTTLMGQADIRLVIPMAVWVALYLVLMRVFVPRIRSQSIHMSEAQSMMTGRLVDSYTNILTAKLFARREHEDSFVIDSLNRHSARFHGKNRQLFLMFSSLAVVNSLILAAILFLCLSLWGKEAISPGTVAMVLPLCIQINNMMYWIMNEVTGIFEWIGQTEDSMETIARPHSVTDREDAKLLHVTNGDIRFEDVSFHYGKGGGIIENLTLHIPPGQKVGLVGHSGAGKTTVASLLLRFYDLEGGRVLIDGQDIADVTQDSLRSTISMVTQDTSLLHRSIADNISYGRPGASMKEIVAAAKRAHAHDFILGLQDEKGRAGYDAHVGERGVKLSGGQRQRIAIARIILKDAPILILDEATSALDSEIESYIQEHLAVLMKHKTVIAIAHRLSTISKLDRLIVLEAGRIVEDGTHEDLLRRNGPYARMWSLQSGGFLPE